MMGPAQGVLWPVPGAQADIWGAWWVLLAAVVPSPVKPSRGAPPRAASGRSCWDQGVIRFEGFDPSAGVVTPAEMPQGAKRA